MDEPARPRFFTVMGWIFILFGIYWPGLTATQIRKYWEVITSSRDLSQIYVSSLSTLVLSALNLSGGWGLFKRRPWAPLVGCFNAGVMVVSLLWTFHRVGQELPEVFRTYTPPVIVEYFLSLLPAVLHGVCWLITVGALFRSEGRRQFSPGRPELTTRRYWIAVTSGAMVFILFQGAVFLSKAN